MRCESAQNGFSDYIDKALAPPQRAALESHLAQCAECRRQLQAWQRTKEALNGLPRCSAPEGFGLRLMQRVRAEGHASVPALRVVSLWPRVAAAAAMLLVAVGVVFVAGRPEAGSRAASARGEAERMAMVARGVEGESKARAAAAPVVHAKEGVPAMGLVAGKALADKGVVGGFGVASKRDEAPETVVQSPTEAPLFEGRSSSNLQVPAGQEEGRAGMAEGEAQGVAPSKSALPALRGGEAGDELADRLTGVAGEQAQDLRKAAAGPSTAPSAPSPEGAEQRATAPARMTAEPEKQTARDAATGFHYAGDMSQTGDVGQRRLAAPGPGSTMRQERPAAGQKVVNALVSELDLVNTERAPGRARMQTAPDEGRPVAWVLADQMLTIVTDSPASVAEQTREIALANEARTVMVSEPAHDEPEADIVISLQMPAANYDRFLQQVREVAPLPEQRLVNWRTGRRDEYFRRAALNYEIERQLQLQLQVAVQRNEIAENLVPGAPAQPASEAAPSLQPSPTAGVSEGGGLPADRKEADAAAELLRRYRESLERAETEQAGELLARYRDRLGQTVTSPWGVNGHMGEGMFADESKRYGQRKDIAYKAPAEVNLVIRLVRSIVAGVAVKPAAEPEPAHGAAEPAQQSEPK